MLKVVVLAGNPKPKSRTLQVAVTLAEKLLGDSVYDLTVVDLAMHSAHIFEWPSETMAALNGKVADADLLVVASPTYKATYTGLLKGFLDRYSANGLRGVTAIPVMTGADRTHAMGPDVNLRPLLVELGASVPTRSLYFVTGQMDQMEQIVADWVAENAAALRLLAPLVREITDSHPYSDVTAVSTQGAMS
jgi:FMN reductase